MSRSRVNGLRNQSRCGEAIPDRHNLGESSPTILTEVQFGRVLVVDDAETSRRQVCTGMAERGFELQEAADGREGLWRLRTTAFDAVITDIHMRGMDGFEFIRELRKLAGYHRTPIFVLTSDSSNARYAEGLQLGAIGWLVKPPNLDALAEAVRDTLTQFSAI